MNEGVDYEIQVISAYFLLTFCNRFISGYKKAPVVIMTTETL